MCVLTENKSLTNYYSKEHCGEKQGSNDRVHCCSDSPAPLTAVGLTAGEAAFENAHAPSCSWWRVPGYDLWLCIHHFAWLCVILASDFASCSGCYNLTDNCWHSESRWKDEIMKTSEWALLALINGPHKIFSFGGDKQEDPQNDSSQ